jgi:hypothetical protein
VVFINLSPPDFVIGHSNRFIPNFVVFGAPKTAADTQCLTSVFGKTPALRALLPTGDLSPFGDKRSSFVRWLGATRAGQNLVDRTESPMRRFAVLPREDPLRKSRNAPPQVEPTKGSMNKPRRSISPVNPAELQCFSRSNSRAIKPLPASPLSKQ